jgi:hypothetical protein
VSLSSNWTAMGRTRNRSAFTIVASTTLAVLELPGPESNRAIGHPLPAPPKSDGFRFVLCPSPDPAYNWLRAFPLIRTVRGLRKCF